MKRPSFWDPRKVSSNFAPDLHRAREEGRLARITSVKDQVESGGRHLLVLIDMERDFMPDGRLPVKGSFEDVERLGERIIHGITGEHYTDIMVTIDKHPPITIHSDVWFRDELGNPPDVTLPVRMVLDDPNPKRPVFKGHYVDGSVKTYVPNAMPKHTVAYWQHLNKTNQGDIWVWPDHCREGTDGVSIVPALAELIEWAAVARGFEPVYLYKGMIAQVDWFGPFRPCMDVPSHPQGGLQTAYLDYIGVCRSTEFAGEAKDFCVRWGMMQALEYFGSNPDVLGRVSFLNDCTSAIFPDSPDVKALDAAMQAKGVQLITHDAPFRS